MLRSGVVYVASQYAITCSVANFEKTFKTDPCGTFCQIKIFIKNEKAKSIGYIELNECLSQGLAIKQKS